MILKNCKQPIDLRDIELLENKYGLEFPNFYKGHLQQFNGGEPQPNIFGFIENGEKTTSILRYLYAVGSGKWDDLEENIKTYKIDEKRMPTHIIPIGEDPLGNQICISSGEKDYGYIYFWDHENEVNYNLSNDNDYSNLYFIANSLDEFLNNLRDTV